MKYIYFKFIDDYIPKNLDEVVGTCQEWCETMHEAFPELKIVKGVVHSWNNQDNYCGIEKEYPHYWLETDEGEKIDPTRHQFCLIEPIKYRRIDKCFGRCINCGRYISTPICEFCLEG